MHVSPDVSIASCSGSVKDSKILLRSDIKGGLAGPKPSQMLAVPCHLVCKRSRYSNRTVKYSNKVVSKPGNQVVPCQLIDLAMTLNDIKRLSVFYFEIRMLLNLDLSHVTKPRTKPMTLLTILNIMYLNKLASWLI